MRAFLHCVSGDCQDLGEHCAYWASTGECENSQAYMSTNCKASCNLCDGDGGTGTSKTACIPFLLLTNSERMRIIIDCWKLLTKI